MKEILSELAWIWGPIMVIGAAVDMFTVAMRPTIHAHVSVWWRRVRKVRSPDLPAVIVRWVFRYLKSPISSLSLAHIYDRIKATPVEEETASELITRAGRRWSLLATLVTIGVSSSLFLMMRAIGNNLDHGWGYLDTIQISFTGLPLTILYIVPNVICDFVTVVITFHLVGVIAARGGWWTIPVVIGDFAAAIGLAIVCVIGMDASTSLITYFIGPIKVLSAAWGSLVWIICPSCELARAGNLNNVLWGATVLIPTALFLIILLTAALARLIAGVGVTGTALFLKAAKHHRPETLPAFSMAAALLSLVISLWWLLGQGFAYIRA